MNKKSILLLTILLLMTMAWFPVKGVSQETDRVSQTLQQAQSLYANGNFEKAQAQLLTLLKTQKLTQEQQLQALILLAEIRRAMLDEDGARKLIDKILDIRPNFTPSPTDFPPTFIALVQSEKQKRKPKIEKASVGNRSFFKNKYFWIGLGGAAATTTAIILGAQKKHGKNTSPLPLPPNWPENVR